MTAPSDAIQTGITNNWTRVRPAFFRGLAKRLEYAEDKCFGLILDSSIGHGRSWARISWTLFCNVAGVTRRRCEQAIASLVADGIIRARKPESGHGQEYAIAVRGEGDSTGIAKCRGCGHVGEVDLDLDFIPVPHSFFLNLPGACDHGMYLIVKTVVERTMRWDRATKQIVVIPCEITIEEFENQTGKKRSEIIQDLAKVQAEGYGFIGSEKIGRTVRYWAKPENFTKGQRRAAREVHQPANKKRKGETEKAPKVDQPTETKQVIHPVEFVTYPCGVCRHCNTYGPVDLVLEVENLIKKPLGFANRTDSPRTANARAGPTNNRTVESWKTVVDWIGKKQA